MQLLRNASKRHIHNNLCRIPNTHSGGEGILFTIKLIIMKARTITTIMGDFDRVGFNKLKDVYELSLKNGMTWFELNGEEWDMQFASYVLEYLSPRLGLGQYHSPKQSAP